MRHWLAVASADHVAIGRKQGFMQVNYGKSAPLRRMKPGDVVTYYSPVPTYRTKTPLQSFTAIGKVRDGDVYQGVMGDGFTPWRRDVDWLEAESAAIAPLLSQLEFTAGRKNWGYALRFGLIEISAADMVLIAKAMRADVSAAKVD